MLKFVVKHFFITVLFCFMGAVQAASVGGFDHSHASWQRFLNSFAKDGLVDYSAVKKDSSVLDRYLTQVKSVSQAEYDVWSDNQKVSFWLNVYNALTVKTVVAHYPIQKSLLNSVLYPANSIQQISNVWDNSLISIMGKALSLNFIEHKILRADFKEPRVHFALVCASIGCPSLRDESYVAAKLDKQLDDQTVVFFKDPIKNRFDSESNKLYLSPIFKWFKDDFGGKQGILSFAAQYFPVKFSVDSVRLRWLGYDWTLNEQG